MLEKTLLSFPMFCPPLPDPFIFLFYFIIFVLFLFLDTAAVIGLGFTKSAHLAG